jgi:hypothetical protein
MKKIYSILAGLLLTACVFAQAPQKMSYQAVIRNSSNALIASTPVGIQISILQGTSSGTPIYVETQTSSTNANGLVSLEIGSGTPITGAFASINWANGPYFIKTETDPTGGINYTIAGTSELMSVPYSLHAKTAENISSLTYSLGLNADLGGYVFFVTPDGRHGLIAATQDQSVSSDWYNAQNNISNPANHDVNGKKFTDWRMPTKYELNLLYISRAAIGGFAIDNYWSSTGEVGNGAWEQNFGSGTQSGTSTSLYNYVRAVRAF